MGTMGTGGHLKGLALSGSRTRRTIIPAHIRTDAGPAPGVIASSIDFVRKGLLRFTARL